MANAEQELPIILELNNFANRCGYFYNAYLRDGISANNGYNCSHPDQEEICDADDDTDSSVGCCYCWSCPLAIVPNAGDLLKYGVIDPEDVDESEQPGELHYNGDCDYILVTDPETIDRLRTNGVTGLAEKPDD